MTRWWVGVVILGSVIGIAQASLPPMGSVDGYVYQEDPCVEALRGAMEAMEPFIPERFTRDGNLWVGSVTLTQDGLVDRSDVGRLWNETKVQCWRH